MEKIQKFLFRSFLAVALASPMTSYANDDATAATEPATSAQITDLTVVEDGAEAPETSAQTAFARRIIRTDAQREECKRNPNTQVVTIQGTVPWCVPQ